MTCSIIRFLALVTVILHAAVALSADDGATDRAQIILQIPYGIKNSSVVGSTGLVVQGSSVSGLFLVESYDPRRLAVALDVEIPKPLELEKIPDGVQMEETADKYIMHASFELVTEFDDWYRLMAIRVPPVAPAGSYPIRASARFKAFDGGDPDGFETRQEAVVRVAAPSEIQRLLSVDNVTIPSDSRGTSDGKFARNSLLIRSDLGFWGAILGGVSESDFAPVSYAGIRMSNHADEDAILLVSWEVLDPDTKAEMPAFRVPAEFMDLHGWSDNRVHTQVFIPGRGESEFVLPIFADRDSVLPGAYLGRVTSRLFGSDAVVQTTDFDLTVRKMSWASVGATLYAVVITLGVSMFLVARQRTLFTRFKTRWLILIALFGSAKFLTSVVPRFLFTELFNGLLGPFAVFATGIFSQISCLLVMALVVLIPLPGVVTLSMLMSMVLFCLIGSFNPVVVLFMMVSMTTMEIALYLTGFTRGKYTARPAGGRALVTAGLGMGTAAAFATFVDYNLYMLLYRLYYAKWYILANVLVVGFVYTAVFAPAGVLLGNKLKRVATE
jgi:hypothetical protein